MGASQQIMLGNSPAVAGDFNLNAVDFDGNTEYMANTSVSFPLGANTVSVWINADTIASGADEDRIVVFQNASSQNLMYIQFYQSKFYAIYGVGGISGVVQPTSPVPSTGARINIVLRHTGAANGMSMWVNGSSALTTTGSSLSGTVTKVYVGAGAGSTYFDGKIARVDYWDTNIADTEVTAIYDSGNGYKLDLRNSFGNYTSTVNLKHQWAPGKDGTSITTMGTDYISSGNINIGTNAVNISSADIVTF